MIVPPQDQIDKMAEIMEYLLKKEGNEKLTVGLVKQKYHLSEREYQMIYDLCMPLIRKKHSKEEGWRTTYLTLKSRIYAALRKDDNETAEKVRTILQQSFYEPSKNRASEINNAEGENLND